jgi:bleomycin hydrolase
METLGQLTVDQVQRFGKEFAADPQQRLLQNALTRNEVDDVALDRTLAVSAERSMSHQLDDWAATNQKQSGRCWLFAGLNLLRVGAARKMGLAEFEFSQNHLLFWDKLEKANFWLEGVIATAGRDVDDRTVAYLMANPIDDGGQWNMFVALVRKHGLVPKAAMPETVASSSTRQLNRGLKTVLRQAGRDLRQQAESGASVDDLRDQKDATLQTIHRMLALHLGTPPETVSWQWIDKDKSFHRDETVTPQEFAQRYVELDIDSYVCLVDDPRSSSPRDHVFTVEHLGNVVSGEPVTYLNVEMSLIKRLARESIVEGTPVWFGCDVEKMMEKEDGLWDAQMYDYDAVYGTRTDFGKADRLQCGATAMTHAMLLTGVDVVGEGDAAQARRWRVENSWGTEKADKGFWTMNDSWFGEHVFEIAVPRSALPVELLPALETEPIVLPAWDPMGALAH